MNKINQCKVFYDRAGDAPVSLAKMSKRNAVEIHPTEELGPKLIRVE
ncbi:hypothetical protein KZ773_02130 [Escherichia coli]|nr:hypothetical protein [Escherichia coli]